MARIQSYSISLAVLFFCSSAFSQNRCENAPSYFRPQLSGDGQRFELTVGPLVWQLTGSGIYPVKASDKVMHVAFAMQFTNPSRSAATLQTLEVVDPAKNNAPTGSNNVISIKDEDVTGQLKLFTLSPAADKTSYSRTLAGGQSGVMFFDLTYPNEQAVPCTIAFRARTLQPESTHGKEATMISPPLRISSQAAIVIAPPFKGDGWVNGNGCCREIGPHRFVTNPMNGTLQPSEQFAIDWIKIDKEGKAFRGDGKTSEQWLCYGTELLAVGPGTVVEVIRDLHNEVPGVAPNNLTIPQIAGNHVTLDLGSGHYAMYDHMAPGSITVHVGERVSTGQKLGLLGNTGNTTGPHLHFQISDRPSTLDTTALPFVFESMFLQGRTPLNLDDIDSYSIKGTPLPLETKNAGQLLRSMPLSRDVVRFP